MIKPWNEPLFIFELANNHMGDPDHGSALIRLLGDLARRHGVRAAVKFQYRDLDTFIHPRERHGEPSGYVKRFLETRLSRVQFDELVRVAREAGLGVLSTPFDEASVAVVREQGLDFVKIASASFTDWPLLEAVAATEVPIIASTAGATVEELDRVVSFFRHRQKTFALMHCVAEYPTPDAHMHLGQIDFLRERFPDVPIGFSTHEEPASTEFIRLAIAKGARIFEKHVGLPTERFGNNAYSASPEQVDAWLAAAKRTWLVCGESVSRAPANEREQASLRSLRRGVFLKRALPAGVRVRDEDVYFAFPPSPGQVLANDWSKYSRFITTEAVAADAPLTLGVSRYEHDREAVLSICERVRAFLASQRVVVPGHVELEISHHYGIERFEEVGLSMFTVVNRGYCKKVMVLLPGQRHPEQHHLLKEETFCVMAGEVRFSLDGEERWGRPGDVLTVMPGVRHAFSSETGAVIEEISSTHHANDSYYTDPSINENPHRKTYLSYWMG
ncbi:MAG: N-acetylneuraminate synthase family protein [Candidatus Sericytochromatia bacterium]|nr:N-acetylneuraminate synthase family protein [Candidatus Sericytochromatia bacterium]